jgi:malate synthase
VGKTYRLNDKIATLQIRPRGWHLDEKHVTVDGQRVSGGIFDFALFIFHNARNSWPAARARTFICPRWNRTWRPACGTMSSAWRRTGTRHPQGTIKATVLIETIVAAFEMDEILYELREHSAGLNAGRWDYIF